MLSRDVNKLGRDRDAIVRGSDLDPRSIGVLIALFDQLRRSKIARAGAL
jgi:hypothetical protein